MLFLFCFLPETDTANLLKVWDAVNSYKSLTVLKVTVNYIKKKNKALKNKISGLQKEFPETSEITEYEKVQMETELSKLQYKNGFKATLEVFV